VTPPNHRDNPETSHEEPTFLFTDKAVVPGARPMTAPAREGHPMLAALLAEVPTIRSELPGLVMDGGPLLLALRAFPDDPTEAQLATALANLRSVLRSRAAINPWLGAIAELGAEQTAGHPHAMTPLGKLDPVIELPDRVRNRTIVEQARQLDAELTAPPTAGAEGSPAPPPQPEPDAP
jgi:hypothetical protein